MRRANLLLLHFLIGQALLLTLPLLLHSDRRKVKTHRARCKLSQPTLLVHSLFLAQPAGRLRLRRRCSLL